MPKLALCFSFRANRWHVYLLLDWRFLTELRRVGPSFPTKDRANAYIAAVLCGEAGLFDPTDAKGDPE